MTNEDYEGSLLPLFRKRDGAELKRILENTQSVFEMALGLVAASSLDEQLGVLLKTFFVEDKKKSADEMLSDTGVLSPFGVRIELAFLLGLISARERGQLHLIT